MDSEIYLQLNESASSSWVNKIIKSDFKTKKQLQIRFLEIVLEGNNEKFVSYVESEIADHSDDKKSAYNSVEGVTLEPYKKIEVALTPNNNGGGGKSTTRAYVQDATRRYINIL